MNKVKIDQSTRHSCEETPNRSESLQKGNESHQKTDQYDDACNR